MERTFILFITLLLWYATLLAQDVIVKKDGSTIISKVLEINQTDVKYKNYSNQNGPVYIIKKSELLAINYENGTKDCFDVDESKSAPSSSKNAQSIVDVTPVKDNNRLITEYNALVKPAKAKLGGYTTAYTYKYGVTANSILSSEDLEISIVLNGDGSWYNAPYVINIRNKTNGIIYLDLANCFKSYPDGKYVCYYDSKQTSISEGSSVMGALGLGAISNAIGIDGAIGTIANGISVGKSVGKTSSMTYSQNRFLTIPPHGCANLSSYKGAGTGKHFHVISNSELFNIDSKYVWISKKGIRKNESIEYSEEESPYKQQYVILYSKDSNFSQISRVGFGVYVQQVLGVDIEGIYDYMLYKIEWWKKFQGITNKTIIGTTPHSYYHDDRTCGIE